MAPSTPPLLFFLALSLSCTPKVGWRSRLLAKRVRGNLPYRATGTNLREAVLKGKRAALKAHRRRLSASLEAFTSRKTLLNGELDPHRYTSPFFTVLGRLDLPCALQGEEREGGRTIAKLTCARRTTFEERLLQELESLFTGLRPGGRVFFPPPVNRAGRVSRYGLMVHGLVHLYLSSLLVKRGSLLVEVVPDLRRYLPLLTVTDPLSPFHFSHVVLSSYRQQGEKIHWRFTVVDLVLGKRVKQIEVTVDPLPGGNPGLERFVSMAALGDGTPLSPEEAVAQCATGERERCIGAFLRATLYASTTAQRRALFPSLELLCSAHGVAEACVLRAEILAKGTWGVSLTPKVAKGVREQCLSGRGDVCLLLFSKPGRFGLEERFCRRMLTAHKPLLGRNLTVTMLAIHGYTTNRFCYQRNEMRRNSLLRRLLQMEPSGVMEKRAQQIVVANLKERGGFFARDGSAPGRLGLELALMGSGWASTLWGKITKAQGKMSPFGSLARLLQFGCDWGNGTACTALGKLLRERGHQRVQKGRAGAYLRKACRLGDSTACLALFRSMDLEKADTVTRGLAAAFLNRGCRRGHLPSCEALLRSHMRYGSKNLDLQHPIAFYRAQCAIRNAKGCVLDSLAHLLGLGYPKNPKKGLALLLARCKRYPQVCTLVGRYKAEGWLVAKDEQGAERWLERGCTRRNPQGCFYSAELHTNRQYGVLHNTKKAESLYQRACDYNYSDACVVLGNTLFEAMEAKRIPPDGQRLIALFTKGCRLHNRRGCTALGALYAKGLLDAVPKEMVRAKRLLARGCTMGDGDGCFLLGGHLLLGRQGAPSALSKGVQLLERGCAYGSGDACHLLLQIYLEKRRGYTNPKKATIYALRACDLGYASGCMYAGGVLREGGDPTQGTKLYLRACRLGSLRGCTATGVTLLTGTGVAKDVPRGMDLLRLTCARGEPTGCFSLGMALLKGVKGAPVDSARGVVLLKKACALQYDQACTQLKWLGKAKTEQQSR